MTSECAVSNRNCVPLTRTRLREETAVHSFSSPRGHGEISRGASHRATHGRITQTSHPALSKRRPDPLCRGRPYQDKVRSVMYFRQDRQASRDQQPHGARARRTALPDSRERRGRAVTQLPMPSGWETSPMMEKRMLIGLQDVSALANKHFRLMLVSPPSHPYTRLSHL